VLLVYFQLNSNEITFSISDRTIKIYDITANSYTPTATLTGHTGPVYQLSWSHPKYSSSLASASFDGSVLIHRESRPGEWILVKAFTGLHDSSVNGVSFAPMEYGLICAAASSDGRVSIMTHEDSGEWTVEYIKDTALGVNSVGWAPYEMEETDDGEVKPAPMRIVTGGSDNGVRVWTKTEGGWTSQTLEEGHQDWVRDVAFAPNVIPGRSVIASCSEDKTVMIWKCEEEGGQWTSMVLHTFEDPVWRVSWSVTGNILAVSSGESNVTLWKEGLNGSWSQVSQVEDVASSD
jgi:protein transport protein SEC13